MLPQIIEYFIIIGSLLIALSLNGIRDLRPIATVRAATAAISLGVGLYFLFQLRVLPKQILQSTYFVQPAMLFVGLVLVGLALSHTTSPFARRLRRFAIVLAGLFALTQVARVVGLLWLVAVVR